MIAFADHFQRHVTPMLVRAAKVQGLFVCCGCRSYAEGHDAVMHLARQRGAGFLTDQQHEVLADWVHEALCTAVTAMEPAWEETQRLGARVGIDIRRHEDRLRARRANGSASP